MRPDLRWFGLCLLGVLLPFPAAAMVLPDCAGRVVTNNAQIRDVMPDGTLILSDGRKLVLEGIRFPGADAPKDPVAGKALDQLRLLVGQAPISLTATAPERDRYGRLRVQAFGANWLQVELLKKGMARVALAPDRNECFPDLLEAEAQARDAKAGLWSLPDFAVRTATSLATPVGRFQVVEGTVLNAAMQSERGFLDFTPDYRKGFSAVIAREDRKAFRDAGLLPEDLVGRQIRLRGVLQGVGARREIVLTNPHMIEILK